MPSLLNFCSPYNCLNFVYFYNFRFFKKFYSNRLVIVYVYISVCVSSMHLTDIDKSIFK